METRHGDMSWRHVMETCHGDMSWRHVTETCHGGILWRHVMEACYGDMLRRHVMEACYTYRWNVRNISLITKVFLSKSGALVNQLVIPSSSFVLLVIMLYFNVLMSYIAEMAMMTESCGA